MLEKIEPQAKYCLFCDRKGGTIFGGLPGLKELSLCFKCGRPLFSGIEAAHLEFLAYQLDHGRMTDDRRPITCQ
jgi:hypothetical protein